MIKRLAVVIVLACCAGRAFAATPDAGVNASFWIDFKGVVETKSADGAVRVVPREGVPLRIENASKNEWAPRDGRWVEVEGVVFNHGAEPVMRVWEFSLEERAPKPFESALETEGQLIASQDGFVLRTKIGDAPLVGLEVGAPAGAFVDIDGYLVLDAGKLAIHVVRAELD